MNRSLPAAVLLIPAVFTATLQAVPMFIGTDAGGQSGSKGIYRAEFDPASGKLEPPQLAAAYPGPGFLVLHPSKPVLLAVGGPHKPVADGTDSVAAFAIGANHSLELLGAASSGGTGACHLAVDPAGHTVAVANYSDGHIATLRLDDRGVPAEIVSVIINHGAGPDTQRQAGPHAHGVYFDPAATRLFVPDLGLDRVLVYRFDPATSKLGEALAPLRTAAGAGPRHLAFSQDQRFAYVINELNGSVLAASLEQGILKPLGTVATLPASFSGPNTTAEIEISPDGSFVYASNRGHDSIAVFRRDVASGALTLMQDAPCGGKAPRHFKIAPGGKWLLCAHQESNTISVLPLDPHNGTLGAPTTTVPCPRPICLLFQP